MLQLSKYHVPEILNVHLNEIDRKLTTIKLNKLKFKKSHFLFQKLIFNGLKKNPFKKSRFFYHFRSHECSELPAHQNVPTCPKNFMNLSSLLAYYFFRQSYQIN